MKGSHGYVQAGSFLFREGGESPRNSLFRSAGAYAPPSALGIRDATERIYQTVLEICQ